MKLKWCSAGLTALALLCGAVWFAHTAATGFSWNDNDEYPWFINGLESRQSASVWWKPYKRRRDAIDLCLHHATYALATCASLSLLGLACRTTYREIALPRTKALRRTAAVLLSASTAVGAAFLVFVVLLNGWAGTQAVWTCPHPAVRRLQEVWQARQAIRWPLDNGMTSADVVATCPGHHLVPYHVPTEAVDEGLREKPSGYCDTDSFYVLTSRSGRGLLNLLLQFRDDRLINFDRAAFLRESKLLMEGKDPYSPKIRVVVEGR